MLPKMDFAADLETPVSAFLKLTPLHPVFLLESVERNETIGRFSFIGILPKEYFVLEEAKDLSRFFSLLETTVGQLHTNGETRLSSGVVGFISYNAAALMLPKLQPRTGSVPICGFVLPSAVLVFDHLKRRLLLTSILNEVENAALVREIKTCLQTTPLLPKSGKSSDPLPGISKTDFCAMVERAREHIAAGDIYQVVLSMQFQGTTDAHPFQLYRALRMINPSPYMFYLNFQDRFQFFGSSPETMVRTDRTNSGTKIMLRPIAGTRARKPDPVEDEKQEKDLLNDEKEKAEHLMLLDLARNDAGHLAETGTVRVTEFMKVDRFSHVMHLVSTVESELSRRPSLYELFSAVFPAGTVTGAPKVRAMQIIDDLEPHNRGLYAGSVGYLGSGGEVDHCIAIRCFQLTGDQYLFTAGAGIVADSRAENEQEEIINKAMALRAMLAMAGEPL